MKITRTTLKHLPPPGNTRRRFFDDEEPGFCIVQSPSGGLTFELRTRIGGRGGQQITRKLGAHPSITPEQARQMARELKSHARLGRDIVGDRRAQIAEEMKKTTTLGDVFALWLGGPAKKKRPTSVGEDQRNYRLHIEAPLGRKAVSAITVADVEQLHQRISNSGTPIVANRVLALLKTILNFAVRLELVTKNPAKGVSMNAETKIERYLSDDEARRLDQALELLESKHAETVAAIRLLLLTGQRRNEVLTASWEDFVLNGANPIWRVKNPKGGKPHTIPISGATVGILQGLRELTGSASGDIFSLTLDGRLTNLKRLWKQIVQHCAFQQRTRIQDLRHTFASLLASRGVSIFTTSKALGHRNISTTLRYAHLFDEELRKGVEMAVR